jgi:hypothetical protein
MKHDPERWCDEGPCRAGRRWWLLAGGLALAALASLSAGMVYFLGGPYLLAYGLVSLDALLFLLAGGVAYQALKTKETA